MTEVNFKNIRVSLVLVVIMLFSVAGSSWAAGKFFMSRAEATTVCGAATGPGAPHLRKAPDRSLLRGSPNETRMLLQGARRVKTTGRAPAACLRKTGLEQNLRLVPRVVYPKSPLMYANDGSPTVEEGSSNWTNLSSTARLTHRTMNKFQHRLT